MKWELTKAFLCLVAIWAFTGDKAAALIGGVFVVVADTDWG